jgi:TIR domain
MRVFLSYAKPERELARELATLLTKAEFDVCDPMQDLGPGDNWPLKIGEALEKSRAMVVLLSPDALKSDLVRHAIEFALGSTNYEHRLIPVVVRPTEDIPWILRKLPLVRLGKSRAEVARHIVDQLQLAEV